MTLTKILVVDDNPTVAETLAAVLRTAGHVVCTATSGVEAVRRLNLLSPTLVIAAMEMPDVAGRDFFAILKFQNPRLLTLATSSVYTAPDQLPSPRMADGFYAKGCSGPRELLDVVESLLGVAGERQPKRPSFAGPSLGIGLRRAC